jgi:predicted phage terminase large subunit-like protein
VIEPLRVYSTAKSAWRSVKYRAHSPGFEEILWPDKFSKERLQFERADYAERGILDTYGQEYLNDPIDATTAYFRRTDFLPMHEGDRETRKSYYAAADLAIGETERSAYSVIVVGGLDSDGFLHIVDVRRGRWDGAEIVEEMFSVHSRWSPEMFRVESENIAKSIGPFIDRKMEEDQVYINIDAKPPTKDKDKRARSIQARMRAGKVRFDKDAEWYADFEEELTKYPKHPYKDQVDAFAWLGLMLQEMVEPETDAEVEETEYRMAMEENFSFGRNAVTGY